MNKTETIVILGASDGEERYANKAQRLLMERGYRVIPVHPSLASVEGIPVTHNLGDVPRRPALLSVYVNPSVSADLADDILALRPKVVIFNPGAENPELETGLLEAGTRIIRACTIMLLTTGRFEEMMGAV